MKRPGAPTVLDLDLLVRLFDHLSHLRGDLLVISGGIMHLVYFNCLLHLQLLVLIRAIHADGHLNEALAICFAVCTRRETHGFIELFVDVLEASAFGFWTHEVDEQDVEEGRDEEDEEESPGDLVEGDWSGDEDDDVGEIESHHGEGCALGSNVRRVDLRHV
jgi:hypothetical protein